MMEHVGLDVIPSAFPLAIKYSAPLLYAHAGTRGKAHPHTPTAYMPNIQTCRYVNTHINRNTPSLVHMQCSQTSPLAGCDYILERGNVLRLRWVDRGDMSALALNFTQDCLPISPCPFLTLRGEFAVGC